MTFPLRREQKITAAFWVDENFDIMIYVIGEVFPWGGYSVIFSVCAPISRTGVQLHEIDIWLDARSLNEFYGALMFPKVNITVT